MYQNVRQVTVGLVMTFITLGITGIVAYLDPFNNHVPWLNWLVLSIFAIAGVVAAVMVGVFAGDSEENFWGAVVGTAACYALGGGFIIGIAVGGFDHQFGSLIWSAFAAPFLSFSIGCLIVYFVGAQEAQKRDPLRLYQAR